MKYKKLLLLFFIGLALVNCKKDKVELPTTTEVDYYESTGNTLILVVGDDGEFEGAYEYDLDVIQLINDSLPLVHEVVDSSYDTYYFCKLSPNPDTLYWYSSWFNPNYLTFCEERINATQLLHLASLIPYDSTQFQLFPDQPTIDFATTWSAVSDLDIVKTYRTALPNSKIGISKRVVMEYNEELGFSLGVQKHFIFLVK